jgi:hypothetical protein
MGDIQPSRSRPVEHILVVGKHRPQRITIRHQPLRYVMPPAVTLDPPTSAQFLQGLGFLLTPDGDGDQAPAYLLVAVRGEPTLQHFDPERVAYWVTSHGRGSIDEFLRTTHVPVDRPFSWGTIRVIDRLDISNDYLTFGGQLTAARLDGFTVAVFASPAPMLRTTGHSQSANPGAHPLTAFFAHLRAASGASRSVEERLASASPGAIYAAYVTDAIEKYQRSTMLRSMFPGMWLSLARQASKLRQSQPVDWASGRGLLSVLPLTAGGGPGVASASAIAQKEVSHARS